MLKYIILATMLFTATPSYAQVSQPREIFIRGEITEPMAFQIYAAMRIFNAEGRGEIVIHITSPGGSVYPGLQIYDIIAESESPTRTICEGYCMSMAAVLLEAGTVRESSASAILMFHGISTSAKGKIPEIMAEVAEAQMLEDVMNAHISERSGMSLRAVEKMKLYDHFMTAKEAKGLGLIDVIRGIKWK